MYFIYSVEMKSSDVSVKKYFISLFRILMACDIFIARHRRLSVSIGLIGVKYDIVYEYRNANRDIKFLASDRDIDDVASEMMEEALTSIVLIHDF